MTPTAHLLAILTCAALSAPAVSQDAAAVSSVPEVRWEPFSGRYRARSGFTELQGRLGRISVPENRAHPEGQTIELAFAVFETENPEPGPPVVYLVGGPGGPGVEYGAGFAMHPLLPVLEHCDVIALDQRGVGLSRPNLSEGPDLSWGLPLDRAVNAEDLAIVCEEAMAAGVDYWTEEGVGLEHYNTRESADDVDDVRRALGIEQIIPWGVSYGSHLGLAYVRRHPEHVARAVLQKVEGPDHTFKLPSTVQRHLEQLAAMVAADPAIGAEMPDLVGTVREVLERLAAEPAVATVRRDGSEVSVTIGPYDVQRILSNALSETRDVAGIPARVQRMASGDWSELAEQVLEERSGEVWSMMAVMMDCASGATRERLKRIEREARDPRNLLADAINAPLYPISCEAAGGPDLGDEFRSPIVSDVPVFFLSGNLDVRTPPENVEELLGGFSNAVHVLVEGTGHDSLEMMSDEYRQLIKAWLRGEPVESGTIVLDSGFRFDPLGN